MVDVKNDNDYTVEEMVAGIQAGEGSYFEPLFIRFLPLVKKVNKLYDLRFMEEEDFYQEARIVLHRALEFYREGRGLKFAGYYKLMLQNRVYSLIRREGATKRFSDKSSVSYDVLAEKNAKVISSSSINRTDCFLTPESILQVKESTEGYFDSLSRLEKEVFSQFIQGKTFAEIAEKMDCELDRVKQAYDRCRLKMKKMLMD